MSLSTLAFGLKKALSVMSPANTAFLPGRFGGSSLPSFMMPVAPKRVFATVAPPPRQVQSRAHQSAQNLNYFTMAMSLSSGPR